MLPGQREAGFIAFLAAVIVVVAAIEQIKRIIIIEVYEFGLTAELAVDPDFCFLWVHRIHGETSYLMVIGFDYLL